MKYYYIKKSSPFNYEKFGACRIGISRKNKDFTYDENNFWEYDKVIKLDLNGENGTKKLTFIKYEGSGMGYIVKMIPELHSIFSQFNMPDHRWYKAEAGYDLEFIKDMKKYFKIEYPDIDLKEKREYWILQFLLQDRLKEVSFKEMSFDIVDFMTDQFIEKLEVGNINSFDEYVAYTENEYQKRKCTLSFKKFIYRKNYDILWGGSHIVFNEKVKAALEASNLINYDNGLEFAEFTKHEIVMLGE